MLKVLMMVLTRLPQEGRSWVEATSHHPTLISLMQHHKIPFSSFSGSLGGGLLRKLPSLSSLHIPVLETVSSLWSPPPMSVTAHPTKAISEKPSCTSPQEYCSLFPGWLILVHCVAHTKEVLNGRHSCQKDLCLSGVLLLF